MASRPRGTPRVCSDAKGTLPLCCSPRTRDHNRTTRSIRHTQQGGGSLHAGPALRTARSVKTRAVRAPATGRRSLATPGPRVTKDTGCVRSGVALSGARLEEEGADTGSLVVTDVRA